jgi:hypothetical protein
LGIRAFVLKPLTIEVLAQLIRDILGKEADGRLKKELGRKDER